MTLKVQLVLNSDSGETLAYELGAEALAEALNRVPDDEDHSQLFGIAAHHPSYAVRAVVAGKDNLTEETVQKLAADSSVDVRRRLIGSAAFESFADDSLVLRLISADPSIAEVIAENVDNLIGCDVSNIKGVLAGHSDPLVRAALAMNHEIPQEILSVLENDPDPSVASAAKVRHVKAAI